MAHLVSLCICPDRNSVSVVPSSLVPGSRRPPSVIQCGLLSHLSSELVVSEGRMKSEMRQKTRRVWGVLSFSFCGIYIKCENFQNFIVEFYLQKDFCK